MLRLTTGIGAGVSFLGYWLELRRAFAKTDCVSRCLGVDVTVLWLVSTPFEKRANAAESVFLGKALLV